MLNLKLGLGHLDRALVELLGDVTLLGGEIDHFLVLQGADRNDRQTRVDLDGRNRIARRRE